MRNYILTLFLFSAIGAFAQGTTMRDVFRQMPDTIVPYLTANNRLDFIDFVDSHMEAEVTNSLGGKSKMLKLNDRYVMLELSEASSLQMRLLSVEMPVDSANQIICMVQNFGNEIRESKICFYSLKWRLLCSNDYLVWSEKPNMYEANLSEEEDVLTLKPSSFLDQPAYEEQKPKEILSIKLKWNGRFIN